MPDDVRGVPYGRKTQRAPKVKEIHILWMTAGLSCDGDSVSITAASHAADHGYRTIADIMTALNPFTGEFYRETLVVSRYTREMFCLMEGRHVHPSTLYPGGVGTVPTVQLFTDYLVRLMKYVEFMKRVVPLHDDLFDFFYEALPGYEEVGRRRILLGCWGSFQDPDHCDYQVQDDDRLGPQDVRHPRRHGGWRTAHHRPGGHRPADPDPAGLVLLRGLGEPGDVRQPRPAREPSASGPSLEPDHGSASAEARLRRQLLPGDVAALARQAHRRPSRAGHRRRPDRTAVGDRARRVPKWSNALERDRARTYFQAYAAASALHFVEKALTELQAGRTDTWTEFEVPDEAVGCGFHEAVRGVLSHHLVIRGGKIANYHPYPPTPWNGSSRDKFGTPGPYEDAVQNTPIFEENGPENFKGIDIMRAVRSFDPCLPCGVHMFVGNGKAVETVHSPMFGAAHAHPAEP